MKYLTFTEFNWSCFENVQFVLVEKKKETITESAGRQQKKKIGKTVKYLLFSCVFYSMVLMG